VGDAKANQYCVYLEDSTAPIKKDLAAFCIAHIDELTRTPDYVVEAEE
jgi:hypothetical protein